MKLHCGVMAIATTGRDVPIVQPQTLEKASGAAEADVDFEEDLAAVSDVLSVTGMRGTAIWSGL